MACTAPISGTRLLSHPRWQAHPGDLEAFVGGPVRGHLNEDGRHRVETGREHFPPVSMLWRPFVGVLSVTHCRRPFWLCCTVEAEASIGPQMTTPAPDILVSMLPGNLRHAVKMPKEATWACPDPDTRCTYWIVQLSPSLLGSGMATVLMPPRGWISHGQLASLFCLAVACLGCGHSRASHMSCPWTVVDLWWALSFPAWMGHATTGCKHV